MRRRFASFTRLSACLAGLAGVGIFGCYEEKLPSSAKKAPTPPPAREAAPATSTQPLPLPSKVAMETSLGRIVIELNAEKAPITVENFVKYVDDKFYDGTIFHRVAKSPAVIQGGGFDGNKQQKRTRAPIKNEAQNGLSNARGTIAMARQNPPHTATAQFYINTQDNKFLDHPGQTGWGYCVFGKVVEGMDVVDKIAGVVTGVSQGKLLNGDSSLDTTPYVDAPLGDCPIENVVIESVRRLP